MSQKLVYELLKELGGTAHFKEIKALAKKKYPESSLYTYVANRLRKLEKWGYIRKNPEGTWSIISEYRDY